MIRSAYFVSVQLALDRSGVGRASGGILSGLDMGKCDDVIHIRDTKWGDNNTVAYVAKELVAMLKLEHAFSGVVEDYKRSDKDYTGHRSMCGNCYLTET